MSPTGASIVVTLDIGGSAAKASAYDVARRACVGQASQAYPAAGRDADPGMFDPGAWWLAAVGALRALWQRLELPAGRYLGITVSAIRIPFVLVGADGEAVMPGLLNKDRRAQAHVGEARAALGAEGLYRLTGHWPAPEFGLPKLLWARANHPQAWRRTAAVLQLHDWFIYQLSGTVASEPSSAAMSQMLDVRAGTWARGLLAQLGIPAGLLPGLRPAGAPAGGLQRAVAEATGFAAGTPVHIGGGDTHMSALSAAAANGIPVVVAGTTAPAVLAVPAAASACPSDASFPLLVSDHVVAGQRVLETNAGATGSVAMLLDDLGEESGDSLRDAFAARGVCLADGEPGEPLTVLAGNPFFGPDGWAASPPPTVIGLRSSARGGDVYRAALYGVCLAIRATLGCLLGRSGASAPFVAATGGMSQNRSWAQLLADVTGAPVHVRPLERISGRAGAVVVTGEDPSSRQPHEEETRVHEPDAAAGPLHDAGLARYQRLYRTAQLRLAVPGDAEAEVSCAGPR
jgi:xylulokinase